MTGADLLITRRRRFSSIEVCHDELKENLFLISMIAHTQYPHPRQHALPCPRVLELRPHMKVRFIWNTGWRAWAAAANIDCFYDLRLTFRHPCSLVFSLCFLVNMAASTAAKVCLIVIDGWGISDETKGRLDFEFIVLTCTCSH